MHTYIYTLGLGGDVDITPTYHLMMSGLEHFFSFCDLGLERAAGRAVQGERKGDATCQTCQQTK